MTVLGERWCFKGEIRNRFNLISEEIERGNFFKQNSENLMKYQLKNKEVMTFWSFRILDTTKDGQKQTWSVWNAMS